MVFTKIKNFFKPPTAELTFCIGKTIFFRAPAGVKVGARANFIARLPEGQEFGAVIQVIDFDAQQKLYSGFVEQPADANKFLSSVLDLPFENRRITPRIDKMLRVLSPHIPGYAAMTRNVSSTGLCLVLGEAFPIGTLVELEMDLDASGTEPLKLRVETRWSAPDSTNGKQHLVGGKFLSITPAQRRALNHFLEGLISGSTR
jgi:hypothetical protein